MPRTAVKRNRSYCDDAVPVIFERSAEYKQSELVLEAADPAGGDGASWYTVNWIGISTNVACLVHVGQIDEQSSRKSWLKQGFIGPLRENSRRLNEFANSSGAYPRVIRSCIAGYSLELSASLSGNHPTPLTWSELMLSAHIHKEQFPLGKFAVAFWISQSVSEADLRRTRLHVRRHSYKILDILIWMQYMINKAHQNMTVDDWKIQL